MFCFYFYAYTLDMFNHMISSVSICFKITLEESIYVEIFSHPCRDPVCFKWDPALPQQDEKRPGVTRNWR